MQDELLFFEVGRRRGYFDFRKIALEVCVRVCVCGLGRRQIHLNRKDGKRATNNGHLRDGRKFKMIVGAKIFQQKLQESRWAEETTTKRAP